MSGTSQKIELKGAREYKSDLEKISKQSKILAAEMKEVASSFTATTTAEEKYQKSAKKLTELYKSQAKEVQEIEKTLAKTAEKYGENSREVDIWREKLANAKAALNNTARAMEENEQALAKHKQEVKENEEAQRKFNEEQKKLKNAKVWEEIGNGAKICAGAVAAVATAAAAAGKALWDLTKKQGEWADALLTTSAQTDISAQTLQEWEYAARFIDTEVSAMQKGLARVAMAQKTAVKAGKDYIETIDGQRISLKKANGESRTAEELFYSELEALAKITDETMQNAAAQDLFGKSFQEMKPLIDAGPSALKAYGEEARKLGLIIGDEDVQALGAFDDEMQRFSAEMDVAGKRLALTFLPATEKVAKGLTDLAGQITSALSDGFQEADVSVITSAIFGKLQEAFSDVTNALPAVATLVTNLLTSIVTFVTQNAPMLLEVAVQIIFQIVQGISEALPELLPACVEMIMAMAQGLLEHQAEFVKVANELILGLADGIIKALPILIQNAPELIFALVKGITEQLPELIKMGPILILKIIEGVATAIGELIKLGAEMVTSVGEGFSDMVSNAWNWGVDLIRNFIDGIKQAAVHLWETVKDIAQGVADFLGFSEPKKGPLSNFHTFAPDMMELFAKGIKDNKWKIDDAITHSFNLEPSLVGGNTQNFGGVSINVYGAQGQDVNALADAVMDRLQMAVNRREMAYA